MPAALSLLLGLNPNESARRRALATWSAVGGAGATAGLFYGGLITQNLGWSWIFWINVPAAVAIGGVALAVLPARGPSGDSRPIDLAGVFTNTVGLAAVIYGSTQSPRHGWTDPIDLGSLAAGALLLVGFAVVERRNRHLMIPPALLTREGVLRGATVLLAAGAAVDGLLFLLTLYLQLVRGYSSEQFAAMAALMTASSIGAAFVAETMIGRRLPTRRDRGLGLLTAASLLFTAEVRGHGSTLIVLAGMVLFGFGMGGAYTAGSVQSLANVLSQDAGIASGLQNIAFTVGSTLGVAMVSTVASAAGQVTGVTAGAPGLSFGFLAVAGAIVVGLMSAAWPRRDVLRSSATDVSAVHGPHPQEEPVPR
jgi:predicted MFS family arabinose efflux permease